MFALASRTPRVYIKAFSPGQVPQAKLLRPPRYKSECGTFTFLATRFDLPFLKFIEVILHQVAAETSTF